MPATMYGCAVWNGPRGAGEDCDAGQSHRRGDQAFLQPCKFHVQSDQNEDTNQPMPRERVLADPFCPDALEIPGAAEQPWLHPGVRNAIMQFNNANTDVCKPTSLFDLLLIVAKEAFDTDYEAMAPQRRLTKAEVAAAMAAWPQVPPTSLHELPPTFKGEGQEFVDALTIEGTQEHAAMK